LVADRNPSVYKQARSKVAAPDEDNPACRPPSTSLIGYTVVMKGELIAGEDLVIEGTFDGTITSDRCHSITVRRIARISGELSASNVHVENGTDLQKTVLCGRITLADD
jgi:cytoskeletal protein CcmA (bactofilin family)